MLLLSRGIQVMMWTWSSESWESSQWYREIRSLMNAVGMTYLFVECYLSANPDTWDSLVCEANDRNMIKGIDKQVHRCEMT